MVDKESEDRILAEYDTISHTYSILTSKFEQLVRDILNNHKIAVHSISSRIKSRKSLADKIAKNEIVYEKLADLYDIIGLRIITYFSEDVDKVASIIEDEFNIDFDNSVDKRRSLAADRFGYLSLHRVISLKENRYKLLEYKGFEEIKAELQIRSILQHAWAEIEHDLGYKSEFEVPQHIRRRFARVASILELADEEFEGIKEELDSYRGQVPKDVKEKPQDVLINLDSLIAFIETSGVVSRVDNAIAKIGNTIIRSENSPVNTYLNRLQQLDLKTIADLEQAITENEVLIGLFTRSWLLKKHTSLPKGISVFYLWLILFSLKDEAVVIEELDKIAFDEPSDKVAKELITVASRARRKFLEDSSNEN